MAAQISRRSRYASPGSDVVQQRRFAPPMDTFRRGRDFAAWLGLTPQQHSTGDKTRLGGISKQGDRYLRRLLVAGATAVMRHSKNKATRLAD